MRVSVKFKPCDLLPFYPVCVVRQCSGSDNNAVMKQGSSQAKPHTHTHSHMHDSSAVVGNKKMQSVLCPWLRASDCAWRAGNREPRKENRGAFIHFYDRKR